jgi:uncharacterized cupin superfamily protein
LSAQDDIREDDLNDKPGVTRLDAGIALSAWQAMPLVGEAESPDQPMERFRRVLQSSISGGCELRAGVWEARAYSERLRDYPYDEIVFVVAGSVIIADETGREERFGAGDCFVLQRGFNGYWRQPETLKIFHMTAAPGEARD